MTRTAGSTSDRTVQTGQIASTDRASECLAASDACGTLQTDPRGHGPAVRRTSSLACRRLQQESPLKAVIDADGLPRDSGPDECRRQWQGRKFGAVRLQPICQSGDITDTEIMGFGQSKVFVGLYVAQQKRRGHRPRLQCCNRQTFMM